MTITSTSPNNWLGDSDIDEVTVDGAPASIVEQTRASVTVRLPEHDAGSVDIELHSLLLGSAIMRNVYTYNAGMSLSCDLNLTLIQLE